MQVCRSESFFGPWVYTHQHTNFLWMMSDADSLLRRCSLCCCCIVCMYKKWQEITWLKDRCFETEKGPGLRNHRRGIMTKKNVGGEHASTDPSWYDNHLDKKQACTACMLLWGDKLGQYVHTTQTSRGSLRCCCWWVSFVGPSLGTIAWTKVATHRRSISRHHNEQQQWHLQERRKNT